MMEYMEYIVFRSLEEKLQKSYFSTWHHESKKFEINSLKFAPLKGGDNDQDYCSSCGISTLKLSGSQREPESSSFALNTS